ncbi:kinase-like domain-containing protein [Mycena floridula]|nr:kinase-like domain-containing protein [Mycena floridula]
MAKGGRLPTSSDSSAQSQSSASTSSSSSNKQVTHVSHPLIDSVQPNDEGNWSAEGSSDDKSDLPSDVEVVHPSNVINNHLLDSEDVKFPDDTELQRRLEGKYKVFVHGGAIQLRRRGPLPTENQRAVPAHSSIDRYAKHEKVGEGTYGIVHKARDTKINGIVALQRIRLEAEDEGVTNIAIREISLLQELKDEHIVRIVDIIHIEQKLHLVSEFFDIDLK